MAGRHRRKPTALETFNRKSRRICVKVGSSVALGYIVVTAVAVNTEAMASPLDVHRPPTIQAATKIDPIVTAPLLKNVSDTNYHDVPKHQVWHHVWDDTRLDVLRGKHHKP